MNLRSLFLLLALLPAFAARQPAGPSGKIYFENPSFEGDPGASVSPTGWQSYTPGSTPDVLPGAWGIHHVKAQDGKTLLGLVTREDGTCEDVSQAIPEPLKAGICYTFSIYLSHTASYVGYNHPIRLRVWGGSGSRGKQMLLTSSEMIDHTDWKQYKFQFVPPRDVRNITLEAYYAPGATFKYRGNILLDNISYIERCDRA